MHRFLRARLFACLVGISVLVLAAGCGTRGGRVPTHPARGQLFFDGKPIPHAIVVLHPVEESKPDVPRPRATVGPDGSFVVETYDAGDGAPAGEYLVTVEWWLSPASAKVPGSYELPPTNRLPARFSKAATSGLRIRIQEGDNAIGALHLKRS